MDINPVIASIILMFKLSSNESFYQGNAMDFRSFEVKWRIIGVEADQPHASITLRWHYFLDESSLPCGHRIDLAPLEPKAVKWDNAARNEVAREIIWHHTVSL